MVAGQKAQRSEKQLETVTSCLISGGFSAACVPTYLLVSEQNQNLNTHSQLSA